ncbi:MAG: alpha-amylase [Cyclobacteriaceae bacterium]|nr:alpha-amylase [Cyclobacteriaceae bacterium]
MIKRLLPALLILLLVGGCKTGKVLPKWPQGVNYEIFVLAFADNDGDGKGDLKGLTARLDYLDQLGVNGVWLMPISPSPSYHKYDVTDYTGIDSVYGTKDDFRNFVEQAHQRNIHVVIDMVLNHTSKKHPWFLEASKGKSNPYRNYYVWGKRDSIKSQLDKKMLSYDSDNIRQWHAVDGDSLAEHYYGFFSSHMPDLNFDNPKVRQEFVEIARFWLTEMKVDGFRLDAARHIYPDDRRRDSHAFWSWFREELIKMKPDVYLVGEVTGAGQEVAPFLNGLPALFNFDMGFAIANTIQLGRDTSGLVKKYLEITELYRSVRPDYFDATIINNHDQNRILTTLGDDEQKARMAASLLFTLPGTPYVYYGEEIGMKGRKPDELIREPFRWAPEGQDPMQTRWEAAVYSTDEKVKPVALQEQDPNSMLHFYRKWIAFRNRTEAMTYGDIAMTPYNGSEIISFSRTYGDDKVLVFHNISDVEVTVQLGDLDQLYHLDFYTKPGTELLDDEIVMPALSTAILKN